MAVLLFWIFAYLAGVSVAAGIFVYAFMPNLLLKIVFRLRLWRCGMRQHWIKLGNKVVSYAEGGHPNPNKVTIILIHGLTSFKESWWQTVKCFPGDQHVIAFDLPGHGTSYNLDNFENCSQTLMEHLHQHIRILGLDQTALHLVGQSIGGYITARYSTTYPQNIACVSLIGPAMFTPVPSLEMKRVMNNEPTISRSLETVEDMQADMDYSLYKKTKIDKQILKGLLHLKKQKQSGHAKMGPSLINGVKSFEEIIPMITAPTQLIWGEHDDEVNVSGIDVFKKCLPNPPTVHILSDCGHAVNRDQPEELAKLLLQHSNRANQPKNN